MIKNGQLTDRSTQKKKKKLTKQAKHAQRLMDFKEEADKKVSSMRMKKELEMKYRIMKNKPTINPLSKSMIQDSRSFLERSQKDMIYKKERLAKLQEKYKQEEDAKELMEGVTGTFQPNL